MIILAIETSCDETAISIIECSKKNNSKKFSKNIKVLANLISSQIKIHRPFGGVVPTLASRAHAKNIFPLIEESLNIASKKLKTPVKKLLNKINLIAVTEGPGLIPALVVGVNVAKNLSYFLKKPIIPVNHLEGHIFSAIIKKSKDKIIIPEIKFPAVALLVSGGHTQLILIKKLGNYKIIGETLDDAAGEAFDKVARLLNLEYPGGPIISKLAEDGDKNAINFPRPMLKNPNLDFSFSGLKTAVLYETQKHQSLNKKYIKNVCASFQAAVIDVLTEKTIKAAKKIRARSIILGGGVAANKKLRQTLSEKIKSELQNASYFEPDISLSGDNALMIAIAAYFRSRNKRNLKSWDKFDANANLRLN